MINFPSKNSSSKNKAKHLIRGEKGEKIAADYLKKQGLNIIEKNFRTRRGEIDLIADDHGTIVFIEVRVRQNSAQVSAAQSIDNKKQQKWKITAQEYLTKFAELPPCRFDAVLITLNKNEIANIEWINGLFL